MAGAARSSRAGAFGAVDMKRFAQRMDRLSSPQVALALLVLAAASSRSVFAAPDRVIPPPAVEIERLSLSPHYRKYVNVEGFPIVGSARVSDHAMLEAAYIVRHMLSHRPDVRDALTANKVRLAVMAHDELTTSVPEHSDLKPADFWNRRARGLGPTRQRPAVSCAEENLLCLKGDPYAAENILVHEFGHAVHDMGAVTLDKTFDKRVLKAYESAKKKGLWKGTYAMNNHHEYWGEGTQSWFDTNRRNDDIHNDIDTREKLKQYDPDLAALLEEVYGDGNWRYIRPHDRPEPERRHLNGFDRTKAPTFSWPTKDEASRRNGRP